jgi:hypothetical protein
MAGNHAATEGGCGRSHPRAVAESADQARASRRLARARRLRFGRCDRLNGFAAPHCRAVWIGNSPRLATRSPISASSGHASGHHPGVLECGPHPGGLKGTRPSWNWSPGSRSAPVFLLRTSPCSSLSARRVGRSSQRPSMHGCRRRRERRRRQQGMAPSAGRATRRVSDRQPRSQYIRDVD